MPVLKKMKSSSGKGKRPMVLTAEEKANLRELKRINKSLKKEKILAHDPLKDLPYQYKSSSDWQHRPPRFSFGFLFTHEELEEYAASEEAIPPQNPEDPLFIPGLKRL
ncbi:hypothetical protein BDN72DRAFT_683435 [Pluteus cervinus]|uniref:Uncharacterized protein n=1 Tax=Pluteus cervinus TaxID=181527 RepID=A0ACD3AR91_9AGAR|nr:hypothetical protein BDN72DRAFT_683435 [Pluteus cervinus]